MATISYVINAIDRASRTFNEVADSAARMGAVIDLATNRVENLGEQADRSAAKLAALTLSMEALKAAGRGGAGGGGGFGGLAGKLFSSIPASIGSLTALAVAIGLVVNALVDFASIIGPAVFGLGSFAAFAAPAVSSIFSGYTAVTTAQNALAAATTRNARRIAEANLDKAWKTLDPGQRGVVKGLIALSNEFNKLAKKFEPDVLKLFNMGLQVANKLLPQFFKIAQASGPAVLQFFSRLARAAASPQFQHFLNMMAIDAPHAIATIGTWIFRLTDWVIIAARAFGRSKHDMDAWVADVFKDFVNVTHWFGELPGKIVHALDSLPSSLKTIGIHAIEGLIGGITGMSGSLMSAVGNIVGGVLGQFGKLLGIKSPSTVMRAMGMNLMAGLANGMNAGAAAVNRIATGHAASLAASYSFGESSGSASSGPDIAGRLDDIASLLADLCDITAGNPAETAAGITGVLAGRRRASGYRAMYGSQG